MFTLFAFSKKILYKNSFRFNNRLYHYNMKNQNIFVDTNILIYYEKYYHGLKTASNQKIHNLLINNNIFYNETVKHEYSRHKNAIIEFPTNIKYYDSKLDVQQKKTICF